METTAETRANHQHNMTWIEGGQQSVLPSVHAARQDGRCVMIEGKN